MEDATDLRTITRLGGTKYLVITDIDDDGGLLVIKATDGLEMWECTVNGAEQDNEKRVLPAIKKDFQQMTLKSRNENELQLVSEKHEVDFILTRMSEEETRPAIQKLFFLYAERAINSDVAEPIGRLQKTNASNNRNAITTKAGMSMINPKSRKRKAAQGVEYN